MSTASPKPTLVVLLHARDFNFRLGRSVLNPVLDLLKERGYPVRVVWGCREFVEGDCIFNHVDLSVIPQEYRNFLARYPRVINRDVVDIRKCNVSSEILDASSDYKGAVIVKTNLNCGGWPDAMSQPLFQRLLRAARRRVLRLLPPEAQMRWVQEMVSDQYPVYASLDEVPRGVFQNPALLVEKFIPEREGDFYCTRTHLFMGDRSRDYLMKATNQIAKGSCLVERVEVETHPDLAPWKKRRGLQFGKLEYVVINNRAVVLDLNNTPTYCVFGNPRSDLNISALAPDLADGLETLLLKGTPSAETNGAGENS